GAAARLGARGRRGAGQGPAVDEGASPRGCAASFIGGRRLFAPKSGGDPTDVYLLRSRALRPRRGHPASGVGKRADRLYPVPLSLVYRSLDPLFADDARGGGAGVS